MYNYFNNSLWTQIGGEPWDFWDELKHFREINQQVIDFCQPIHGLLKQPGVPLKTLLATSLDSIHIGKSQWNKEFNVEVMHCILMAIHKYAFR